ENMKELIEDMEEYESKAHAEAEVANPADPAPPSPPDSRHADLVTLCLPAKDAADEIAGMMLAQLLTKQGFNAQSVSVKTLASEMLDQVAEKNAAIVCISALPPMTDTHARYLNKRLKARFPEIMSVI